MPVPETTVKPVEPVIDNRCATLEARVAMVEEMIHSPTTAKAKSTRSGKKVRPFRTTTIDPVYTESTIDPEQHTDFHIANELSAFHEMESVVTFGRSQRLATLGASISHLSASVSTLDHVFVDLSSLHERRIQAATLIVAFIRGSLRRQAYQRTTEVLQHWYQRYTWTWFGRPAVRVSASVDLAHRRVIHFQQHKDLAKMQNILACWHRLVCITLAPLRHAQNAQALVKACASGQRVFRNVFLEWKEVTSGPSSRKQCALNYQVRLLRARSQLESLKRYRIITNDMVKEEYYRQAVRTIRQNHEIHVMKGSFRHWIVSRYRPYCDRLTEVSKGYENRLVGKVWTQMKAWLKERQVLRAAAGDVLGTDESGSYASPVPNMKWARTTSDFRKRHNMRKIEYHAQLNLQKRMFRWWLYQSTHMRTIRQKTEEILQSTLKRVFRAFASQARVQHTLRLVVIREWKAYSVRLAIVPFRHWFLYIRARQMRHKVQRGVIASYQRKQKHTLMYHMFRGWKHQTLYGSVEGMHTKFDLIKVLEDQKLYSEALRETLDDHQDQIKTMEIEAAAQHEIQLEQQRLLLEREQEQEQLRYALHAAQQQIMLCEGLMRAMGECHPRTLERLKKHFETQKIRAFDFDVLHLASEVNDLATRQHACDVREKKLAEQELDLVEHGVGKEAGEKLRRLDWVLSRMSLLSKCQEPPPDHRDSKKSCSESESELPRRNDATTRTRYPLTSESAQLYALLSFIQSGDSGPLVAEHKPELFLQTPPEVNDTVGGPVISKAALIQGQKLKPERLMQHHSSNPSEVQLIAKGQTWNDFMTDIAHQFPPRRIEPIEDQLLRRIQLRNDKSSTS